MSSITQIPGLRDADLYPVARPHYRSTGFADESPAVRPLHDNADETSRNDCAVRAVVEPSGEKFAAAVLVKGDRISLGEFTDEEVARTAAGRLAWLLGA